MLQVAHRAGWCGVIATVLATLIGCGRSAGSGNEMPPVRPSSAAAKAIELYDKDGNGSLSDSELAICPGILAVRNRYDTDGNGEISQSEIETRLSTLFSSGTPWITVSCHVMQKGKVLSGATVNLVPEPFLAESLSPATGLADGQGLATPAVADEKLPDDKKGLNIVRPGVYRVEIKHAAVKEPHRLLGCEIDYLSRGGTEFTFNL